jgi:excisionase family DNA binding protein
MQTETQSRPQTEDASAARLAMTVEETAARLGISRPTAYEAVKTGSIPSIKIGRRILVPLAALERMLAGESK